MKHKLKEETPELAFMTLHNGWLLTARDFSKPKDAGDVIAGLLSIMAMWFHRFDNIKDKVDPSSWSKEARESFLREADLKAYILHHATRDMRWYLERAGLWEGDATAWHNGEGHVTVNGRKIPVSKTGPKDFE